MKTVGVCGHFGEGLELLNGQTIKTKIVTNELRKQLGDDQVSITDSHGGAKAMPRMLVHLFKMFKECKCIIMMPAHKGVQVFTIVFTLFNLVFKRKLLYVVIGGWIDGFVDEHKWLKKLLMNYDGIFVETSTMKKKLEGKGFLNVFVMPNFKKLEVLSENELVYSKQKPFKVCTFSRVMKQKGIEDAIQVVKEINEKTGSIQYELDIYGQLFQYDEFEEIKKTFPSYIRYRGAVPFDESVSVLKDYFALLFPTKFYTEGIPGTIIDAYAAGVPVISAKWESYADVIEEGGTGLGYDFDEVSGMKSILENAVENPEIINGLKNNCLVKTYDYMPEKAIQILIEKIGEK